MRHDLFRLALLVVLALPAAAPGQTRSEGIESVISRQIEAFRADDLDRAFTFASPMIQGMFGTPGNFGVMVRRGYPMVWRPSEVTMGGLREEGGKLIQSVLLRDASGKLFLADYEMVEVDGAWRINGVWIRPASETGA